MTVTIETPKPSSRLASYDGLRGLAIVLVVLSHGFFIWPIDYIESHDWAQAVFKNGNAAVSIFFVVGAFLTTRSMLARAQSVHGFSPTLAIARRYVRLSGQLAFFLAAVGALMLIEADNTYADKDTKKSVLTLISYTFNWYVKENALLARPDFGHLWYLSVELQVFVLVALLVYLLGHRPGWLIATLSTLILMVFAWRSHIYQTEGLHQALLRTNVRMDAPLTGALAACLMPYFAPLKPHAKSLLAAGTLGSLPLLWLTGQDAVNYFTFAGDTLDLTIAATVVAVALGAQLRGFSLLLANPLMAMLGRRSLGIYIWHFPVIYYLYLHTPDWQWGWRLATAAAVTAGFVLISEYVVQRAVNNVLDAKAWRLLDGGLSGLATKLRQAINVPSPAASRGAVEAPPITPTEEAPQLASVGASGASAGGGGGAGASGKPAPVKKARGKGRGKGAKTSAKTGAKSSAKAPRKR